jgi:predicted nucleotidyltransferase
VLLFGSVARGDFTQYSDADVLVVTREPTDWKQVYQYSDGIVQPVVKTLEEIETLLNHGEPFWIEVIQEGIVLYEELNSYSLLYSLAEQARRRWKLRREAGGWSWEG